ncbi:MAG: tRNA 2-thiocytidine(32) synthetase TtcA, partial [Methylobacter sp.]|nr:tRNA 2-thiocytidine(32) synthetase TtcA [Methylobacter sp.]
MSDPNQKSRIQYNKLQKQLRHSVGDAIADYKMIENGDKIMVCLSGGKDSFTLLDILMHLQKTAPVEHILPEYFESLGVPYHIIEKDTYSVVKRVIPEGNTTCGLCSRLRRGTLYGYAEANNVTKIALGHHRDDILETFFLNIFYGGKLKAMPPKLLSDDKKNIIIRPLAYTREKDIERLAVFKNYPIIPCNLCGSQENRQRQAMKVMLKTWDK